MLGSFRIFLEAKGEQRDGSFASLYSCFLKVENG